jgi:hypothetical protein
MESITLENYPDIRDLTRKMSKDLQVRIGGHLETIKTHFRPAPVFGSHLSSFSKSSGLENPKNAEVAFAQLRAVFKQIAISAQLNVEPSLPDAIDINFATPALFPFVYRHAILTAAGTRHLTVTAPFRFVLAYPEYSFSDLRTLVDSHGSKNELHTFVLQYAVLNYIVMQNKRLLSLFEDLRFPIRSEYFDEFGTLPITTITAPAGSVRPPDAVVAQVCKFLGTDSAEELVDLGAWSKLPDPLADWFRGEAAGFGVTTGAGG